MNKTGIMLLSCLTLFCINCALMEGAGRALDGSAFAEKKLAVYRSSKKNGAVSDMDLTVVSDKDGHQSIIISVKEYPMIKFRGSMPGNEGIFHLTSLEYLSGNTQGWNEYSKAISGTGWLILGNNAILEYINEIEPIQITSGRINRYDTRITGNDALTALRNRDERINTLTEWMLSIDAPNGLEVKLFEKYWKHVFFPEMVSAGNRPAGWQEDGDQFIKAEDIRWNLGYTERVFPEELHNVRNSGTLLRDWEEAFFWIYIKYEWNSILNLFTQEIILEKTK